MLWKRKLSTGTSLNRKTWLTCTEEGEGEKSIPIKWFFSHHFQEPTIQTPSKPCSSIPLGKWQLRYISTDAAGFEGNKTNLFLPPRTDSALWRFKQLALWFPRKAATALTTQNCQASSRKHSIFKIYSKRPNRYQGFVPGAQYCYSRPFLVMHLWRHFKAYFKQPPVLAEAVFSYHKPDKSTTL